MRKTSFKILAFIVLTIQLLTVFNIFYVEQVKAYTKYTYTTHQTVFTISNSTDDAYWLIGYEFSNNSTLGYLKSSSYDTYAGFKFTNITIPKNSDTTITQAYLSLYSSDPITTTDCIFSIYGIDSSNPMSYDNETVFTSQDLTSKNQIWNAYNLCGGLWRNSTNIYEIMQEIMDRGDWNTGDDIALQILSAQSAELSHRSFRTYDYTGETYTPKLYITYKVRTPVSEDNPEQSIIDNYTYDNIEIVENTTEGYTIYKLSNNTATSGFIVGKYWYNASQGNTQHLVSNNIYPNSKDSDVSNIKEFNGVYYTVKIYYDTIYRAIIYKSVDKGETWTTLISNFATGSSLAVLMDIDKWGAMCVVYSTLSYGACGYIVYNVTSNSYIKTATFIFSGYSNQIGALYLGKNITTKGIIWFTCSQNGDCRLFYSTSYTSGFSSFRIQNLNPYGSVLPTGAFWEDINGIHAYYIYCDYASDFNSAIVYGVWIHNDHIFEAKQTIGGTMKGGGSAPSITRLNSTGIFQYVYPKYSSGSLYTLVRGSGTSATWEPEHFVKTYSGHPAVTIEWNTAYASNKYTIISTSYDDASPSIRGITITLYDPITQLPNQIAYYTYNCGGINKPCQLNKMFVDTSTILYVITDDDGNIIWEGEDLDDIPEYIYSPPQLLNATLNSISVGESWLFKGEVYKLKVFTNNTQIINMHFNDTLNTIYFYYHNSTKSYSVYVKDADGTHKNELIIGSLSANSTYYSGNIIATEWKFILNKNIVDSLNNTLSFSLSSYNSTTETITSTINGDTDININIYNLGGIIKYKFVGDGEHIIGGSPFELTAKNSTTSYNCSSAYAEIIYRRMQAYHALVELDLDSKVAYATEGFEHQANIGYLEYGIDYKLEGNESEDWIIGWSCRIIPTDINVGTYAGGTDNSYEEFSIYWYNRGNLIRGDEDLYSYHWGYDKDLFPTPRTSTSFWVDFWFDKANSSTVFGGRINMEYYGMIEFGNPWWFNYGGFRPLTGNTTTSSFYGDVKDSDGYITTSKSISLVRIWERVVKNNNGAQNGDADSYTVKPITITSTQLAQDRMDGVDTPTFVETKTMIITGYGAFDPILSLLGSLGTIIGGALFNVQKMMISGLDTFLSWFGIPSGFIIKVIEFLTNLPNTIIFFLSYIVGMLFTIQDIMIDVFLLLGTVSVRWILGIGWSIYYITTFITTLISLLSGSYGFGWNIWVDFNLEQILFICLACLPLWWYMRVISSNNKIKTIHDDVEAIKGFWLGLVNLYIRLSIFAKELIMSIIQTVKG